MLSSKYVKDYRMDTQTSASGKVKRKMVYVGPHYVWSAAESEMKTLRLRFSVLTMLGWILFIGSQLFYSNLSRVWYVVLPYEFFLIILLMWVGVLWNLFFAKQPMTRETRDKTCDRLKGASVAGIVCSLVTVAGIAVAVITRGYHTTADISFMMIDPLLFHLMQQGRKLSKKLTVTEQVNPLTEEWKNK